MLLLGKKPWCVLSSTCLPGFYRAPCATRAVSNAGEETQSRDPSFMTRQGSFMILGTAQMAMNGGRVSKIRLGIISCNYILPIFIQIFFVSSIFWEEYELFWKEVEETPYAADHGASWVVWSKWSCQRFKQFQESWRSDDGSIELAYIYLAYMNIMNGGCFW